MDGVEWTNEVKKVVVEYAAGSESGTLGPNPVKELCTIRWKLRAGQIATWYAAFAPTFNSIYRYQCLVKGEIYIRPTTTFGYPESNYSGEAWMEFERVG